MAEGALLVLLRGRSEMALPAEWRMPEAVRLQLVDNAIIVVLAARVFGHDALVLLRRAAAAGVRVGMGELRRTTRGEGPR